MSQNDFVIANQTAPNFRADALQALASLSSGSTAPSTTYANMLWYDTGNNILKMRTEADDAWIDIGTLNQSTNEFEVANLPEQTELTQAQVEDDTDTTFGLVNGERLNQSIESNFNVTGNAPMYACRAWVNFEMRLDNSIRDSGNVSSITDNGRGDHTVNFATAMPDADYAFVGNGGFGTDSSFEVVVHVPSDGLSTSSVQLFTSRGDGTDRDCDVVSVAIFR